MMKMICWYIEEPRYLCFIGVYFLWLSPPNCYLCIISRLSIIFLLALCMYCQYNWDCQNRCFIGFVCHLKKDIHCTPIFFLLWTVLHERLLKLLLFWFLPSLIFHCVHIFRIIHIQTILRLPLLSEKHHRILFSFHFWAREWGKHFISISVKLSSPTIYWTGVGITLNV